MEDISDLPIALRRTRRSHAPNNASEPCASSPVRAARLVSQPRTAETPKSTKRRVRFSDPLPASDAQRDVSSTGLTPMIRRTCLSSGRDSRRRSTPARLCRSSEVSRPPVLDPEPSPFSGEIHVLPLRQVLDGRVKRRIRRNGLSEEMNAISAEKRRRAQETKAEIERLRAELAERDEEIARLHDETVVVDSERVWELEQQVDALRRELAAHTGVIQQVPSSPAYEWARAARALYSDEDLMELDVEDGDAAFGETTAAEFLCSTPSRRVRTSFPTPPATSPPPPEPQTPCRRPAVPPPSIGVQASLPDPEKKDLEEEVDSLRLDITKLTDALESYSALTSRLSDQLSSFCTSTPSDAHPSPPRAGIETRLAEVLQTLSDRTAALSELDASLKGLGFPGSDAFEVVESIRTGLRAARLELEYLSPGELTLPLTGSGAEVLDLVLTRLRALAQQTRDAEAHIDEYHALELSLRQQLAARVDAMDGLAARLAAAAREAHARDARVAELEVGLDRLKAAGRAYARDIAELEALVQCLEAELAATSATAAADRAALREARETAQRVRAEKDRLERDRAEVAGVLEGMRAELERAAARIGGDGRGRAVEDGNRLENEGGGQDLAGEGAEAFSFSSAVRGKGAEDKEREGGRKGKEIGTQPGGGTKRRRYDSGLGFLDDEVREEESEATL